MHYFINMSVFFLRFTSRGGLSASCLDFIFLSLEVIVCFYFICYHNALWFCWNGAKLACLCVRVMKGGKSRRAAASLMHFESGTRNRHETKKLGEFASVQQPLMNRAQRSFTLQWLKVINVCKLSSCLSWPMKLEKIASKEHERKALSWTSWVMQPFSEGNKTLRHIWICYNSSLSRKRWKKQKRRGCCIVTNMLSICLTAAAVFQPSSCFYF